jgi:hypothetical protein
MSKINDAFNQFNTPKISQGNLKPYENHFEKYRKQVKMFCELGVSHGASLIAWKKYFSDSFILGIDNDSKTCKGFENFSRKYLGDKSKEISIEIGDAMDKDFLNTIGEKYGDFDIILDDCSHLGIQMITSFEVLWKHAKLMYVIEDLQTQFNPDYIKDGNCIDYLQTLVNGKINQQDITNSATFKSNKKTISHISFENHIAFIYKENNE